MTSLIQPITLEVPTISEALQNGINLIKSESWRYHQRKSIESGFMRFCKETALSPSDPWWSIKPLHIFNYVSWMEDGMGWKRNTVSHYLNPLRKASTWVFLNYPDQWKNIFERKMRRNPSHTLCEYYLMPDQLATAVKVSKLMGRTETTAALMFGGLAGLGISEMADLTGDHIGSSTLRVVRAKTAYRPRVVPMVEQLQPYADAFKSCLGRIPGRRVERNLTKLARKVLDACYDETNDETFLKIDLHQSTRVTFVNFAAAAGVPKEFTAAYVGHVGETTLERHYLKLIPRHLDLPRIQEQKISQLQSNVCDKINLLMKDFSFIS